MCVFLPGYADLDWLRLYGPACAMWSKLGNLEQLVCDRLESNGIDLTRGVVSGRNVLRRITNAKPMCYEVSNSNGLGGK